MMESEAIPCFSDMGLFMEEPFSYNECDIMDFFIEDFSTPQEFNIQSSLSPVQRNCYSSTICTSSYMEVPPHTSQRPIKHQKPKNYETDNIQKAPDLHKLSPSPTILNFGNPNQPEIRHREQIEPSLSPGSCPISEVLATQKSFANVQESDKSQKTSKNTYDHIIAERKRREQISQRFATLSTLVPGLKKMDKNSVLGDTIMYLKQLQDRVKNLEEQAKKQRMESFVLGKKSQTNLVEDEGSSNEMDRNDDQELPLPVIEAKVCEKNVLIKIQCQKSKGVLVNLLSEIENHNLVVSNTSVSPFGDLALDITIIAEMAEEFNMSMKELIRALQSAVRRPPQED